MLKIKTQKDSSWRLNIEMPSLPTFCVTLILFWKPWNKNLYSLSLKCMWNCAKVSLILFTDWDIAIWVLVYINKSLFVTLLSLMIYLMCFDNDCIFWKNMDNVSKIFKTLSIKSNKLCCFKCLYTFTESTLTLMAFFLYSPVQNNQLYVLIWLRAAYISPCSNDLYFCELKLATHLSKLRLWTCEQLMHVPTLLGTEFF